MRKAPIKWEPVDVTPQLIDGKTSIPQETITSIERNKVALKGPLAVRNTLGFRWHLLIIIDSNWKRSRLPESDSATNIQSFRQRTTLPIHRWLQDPLR